MCFYVKYKGRLLFFNLCRGLFMSIYAFVHKVAYYSFVINMYLRMWLGCLCMHVGLLLIYFTFFYFTLAYMVAYYSFVIDIALGIWLGCPSMHVRLLLICFTFFLLTKLAMRLSKLEKRFSRRTVSQF